MPKLLLLKNSGKFKMLVASCRRYYECKRYPKKTQTSATIQTYKSGNPTWTFLGPLL